jgi:uncharacterized membrane protein
MSMTWAKVKLWTRLTVFGLIFIYVALFVFFNRDAEIDPALDLVFKKYHKANALLVLLLTSVFSILGWWLFKTIFKTLRQMSEVKRRAYLERRDRELAEMQTKAAKLQTRPDAP